MLLGTGKSRLGSLTNYFPEPTSPKSKQLLAERDSEIPVCIACEFENFIGNMYAGTNSEKPLVLRYVRNRVQLDAVDKVRQPVATCFMVSGNTQVSCEGMHNKTHMSSSLSSVSRAARSLDLNSPYLRCHLNVVNSVHGHLRNEMVGWVA